MPYLTDPVVIAMLMMESIELGHDSPDEGFTWAEENGFIESTNDSEGDDAFIVLDAGREHVSARVIVPGWN